MLLGVDIGGTKCALILATDGGEILERIMTPTTTVEKTLAWICGGARDFAAKHMIRAVGISCGGPLDTNKGLILSPPNLPGWDAVPITRLLTEATGAPAFLCNDANACALAEWKFGAGRGSRNMIFLTFGTGMGAGLILDGRLYEGTTGMAGEVGHMRLAETGPVGYGKAGSFEGFCSGGGIGRMAQKAAADALAAGKTVTWCQSETDIPNVTAKTVAEAAKAGDDLALEVYRVCGRKLGAALAILIDILNPDCIVIGSVFARSGELLREEMEAVIAREALEEAACVCRILPAQLGDAIGDWATVAVAQRGWEEMDHV